MAYIHIKRKNGKQYYYLRNSFVKDRRNFTQDICYLGNESSGINIKKFSKFSKIKNLNPKCEFIQEKDKIRDQKDNKYFNKEQMRAVNATLNHYNKNSHTKIIIDRIIIKFIKENTSMDINEINYPTIKETHELLKNRIFPNRLPLIQTYKLINTEKILNYLEKNKPAISIKLIENISDMLYEDIFKLTEFRKKNIKQSKEYFQTFPANKIKLNLIKLLRWYYKEKNKIHPLALSVLFHHKFEKIHPLPYGNGEIGRIIMNYMLYSSNYPILIIKKRFKEDYLKTLKRADMAIKKDLLSTDMRYYKPLMDFMQKQFVKTYWDNFVV